MTDRTEERPPRILLELAVADLALIERVRLRLGPGLNVLTGETGAGKSLVIDALGLVTGARADTGLVRAGAQSARVEAVFDDVPEPLICVREVSAAGRSLARIGDETVTAARLADVAAPLVEVHGQHEQARLLSAAWQRDLLDAYGRHGRERERVRHAVDALRANEAALAALTLDPAEVERQVELHRHTADEVAAAGVRPGEAEELRATLAAAANAGRIAQLTASVVERLAGERAAARDVLALAAVEAQQLAALDAAFASVAERVEGLAAEAEELAREVRGLGERVDHDPRSIAGMEARLGVLYGLFRKYGESEEAVLAAADEAALAVERLERQAQERAERVAARGRLQDAAAAAAGDLSARRATAAAALAGAVSAVLADLGFARAELAVEVRPAPLDGSGADRVEFLFAPNPGEPPRPLARIASGGELSRVALALETVLAGADATPTLVFDEIDAGIGGRSADPVGRTLWRLARDHQVLCVTHLPQIAVHADRHFQIRKQEHDGRTRTDVRELEGEERVAEIAAMLGGGDGTAAHAAARELLARAADARAGSGPRPGSAGG